MSAYSQTASGLSALGRARQHALTEQASAPPGSPERHWTGPAHRRARSRKRLLPAFKAFRIRSPAWLRRGRAADRLSFAPRRSPRGSRIGTQSSRRWRRPTSIVLRVVLAAVVLAVVGGIYAIVELTRPVPRPELRLTGSLPATVVVPGARPSLPWPHGGEAAVALTGFGLLGSSGPVTPVPIASVAKVMTALVVLRDHPLRAGQGGPVLGITPADVALYRSESAAGDSVTPVATGERFNERQLLDALLIPSADNMASVLARWDAGSDAAFVGKMNSTAARLGMNASHYADANGLSGRTVGTALDQLKLAQAAAANPVLMSIVSQPAVTLPDGTTLRNYDTLLGRNGVIGIKTGSTTAAGGCFMLAARGLVRGHSVEVLGVVLGQHASPLIRSALDASRALIGPALAAVRSFTAVPAGAVVAQVVSAWARPVAVRTTRPAEVMALGGTKVRLTVKLAGSRSLTAARAGSPVAVVTAAVGAQVESVPAATAAAVPAAPLGWRLERLKA